MENEMQQKKTCMDLHFGCEILATQPRDCYDLSASSILGPDDLLSRGFQRQQQISISTPLLSQRQTKHLNRPKHKVPASKMLLANDIVESTPCSLTGTLDFSSRLKHQISASEMPQIIERTRSRENVFFHRQNAHSHLVIRNGSHFTESQILSLPALSSAIVPKEDYMYLPTRTRLAEQHIGRSRRQRRNKRSRSPLIPPQSIKVTTEMRVRRRASLGGNSEVNALEIL